MLDTIVEPDITSDVAVQADTTSDVAIRVENVGKHYLLYNRPQDRLKQMLLWRLGKTYGRGFWALRNVSFTIQRGETLGIIGRNGSGKSTLLQIIAGTLQPSGGEVQVSGRVAALLELGSGFNPEFTGRENVFMNGAILGMSRPQMEQRFDEIAAFADIGQFIDQPVKLYSSGMVMRLAFAVQVFVPKEILIVDEALAVGDEAFQHKCMVALDRFRDDGGTLLFVSHAIQSVLRQCRRCILLHEGHLLADDESKPVSDLYQKILYSSPQEVATITQTIRRHGLRYALTQSNNRNDEQPQKAVILNTEQPIHAQAIRAQDDPFDWYDPNMPGADEVVYGTGAAEIVDDGIYNEQERRVNVLIMGRRYVWRYKVHFYRDVYNAQFGIMMKTVDGLDVAGVSSDREKVYFEHVSASSVIEVCFSIKMNVAPGVYFLNAGIVGGVDGEHIYLHRRVDISVVRVVPCDARETYGIVHLEPIFTYSYSNPT